MKIVIAALQRLSANGICAQAVVSELVRRGHEVVWVCNHEFESHDRQDGVEFREIDPRWVDVALARHPGRSAAHTAIVAANRFGMLRSLGTWPLVSKGYSRRVTRAVCEACVGADIVVGAYTQIDALIAAHEAKSRNPRLHYIAWFLDSFVGGYGPRFLSAKQLEERGKRWDRELLDNADVVVSMESARCFHMDRCVNEPWFEKMRFLDLPLLDLHRMVDCSDDPGTPKGVKTIVYAGSLPKGIRSPRFFLNVLSCMPEDPLRVVFVGDAANDDLNAAASSDRRIEIRGRLSHGDAVALLRSADFVLTLGNRLDNMTPSKVFELMALRKPILATYPIDDEPSMPYLKRYGDVLLLDERSDASEAATKLRDFLRMSHEPPTVEELEKNFWNNTPSAFCDLIELLGDK